MRPSILVAAILCSFGFAPIPTALAQSASSRAIDRANMDTTCSACSDFFDYANGAWLRTAQIPATKTSLGSFAILSDRNEAVVHGILEDDAAAIRAATAKPGTNQWKVGTFYASCMDTAGIAARGIEPLRPTLDAISSINSTADLVRVFGASERRNGIAPFGVGPAPDPKNNKETIVSASQGGLGLPDRQLERLKTAVSEAAMNAIEHGNKANPDVPVEIEVLASDDDVRVRITDQGGGPSIPDAETPDIEAKLAG